MEAKYEKLMIDNNSNKQQLIFMNEKIDKLTSAFEDFTKEIRDNMPNKNKVEENTQDIKQLKGDRFKFIIWIVIALLWFIWTVTYEIVSYFLTK